ncbi:PE domain-containing protein, partial [Mycobacterium tuberculosis]|nr:PE domain-containing protein [Mycobacterium tuberculosis]
MSFVIANPEMLAAAATDLAGIRSAISAAKRSVLLLSEPVRPPRWLR